MNTVVLIVLLFSTSAIAQAPQKSEVAASPTVREEQTIEINGVREIWRLQWSSVPKQHCGASNPELSLTCPCMGFAYGEAGDLNLVRMRDGKEIDRLRLTPLFADEDAAIVQHWPADYDNDFKLAERNDFTTLVQKRATVEVMRFADYDHDGNATEFYLQTEPLPCGKSFGVVIGISKSNPHLHVFGTAADSSKPLYLQQREWAALRDARSSPVRVTDWECGDHAAEDETELELNWSAKGIDGIRKDYNCPGKDHAKRLINQVPLSEVEGW